MEPLRTDEPLPEGQRTKNRDFDNAMLAGCSSFVFAALGSYFMSTWPFYLWQEAERSQILLQDCACGVLPALAFGIFASRKALLAGACGFVAGFMATSVFLFLRLDQVFVEAKADRLPPPDYPEWLRTAIPFGLVVLAVTVAVVSLPSKELDLGSDSDPSD